VFQQSLLESSQEISVHKCMEKTLLASYLKPLIPVGTVLSNESNSIVIVCQNLSAIPLSYLYTIIQSFISYDSITSEKRLYISVCS